MHRIVCPACARRTAEIITQDCAVCAGDGVLHLHPAAVGLYTVEVVAEAVRVALEACARFIDDGTLLSAPQADLLADKVSDLVTGRLIYFPEQETAAAAPVVPIRRSRRKYAPAPDQPLLTEWLTPVELAADHGATPLDAALISADPIPYGAEDRPLMRGLPVVSAAGHPSSLARICDPVDQLASTRSTVASTKTRARQATVLVTALPKAVKRRSKAA